MKQARLLGISLDPDDFSHPFDGFLDRIGRLIVQFNVIPAAQRRQGLESPNCQ
jgi:hypothetical protein